jgi:hypothetical protein
MTSSSGPVCTVLGSDDVTFQQMAQILNTLGLDLIEDYIWPQLVHQISISVPAETPPIVGRVFIDLPPDFDRWIDDTLWDEGGRSPAMGPPNEQVWQSFSQFVGNSITRMMWRSAGDNQMELKPPGGGPLSLRYVSRAWVRDNADIAAYRDHIEKDTDRLLFDEQLLLLGLIYKFRERKGFDTTAEKRDYEYRRDKRLGDTRGAATLSITGRSRGSALIGHCNIPDSGYGR